jgi:hypothetical protein
MASASALVDSLFSLKPKPKPAEEEAAAKPAAAPTTGTDGKRILSGVERAAIVLLALGE